MSGAMGRAPVTRRVRAYFAPVNRMTGVPTLFDAAASGGFAVEAPPAPWVDLGWCRGFARRCGTKVVAMRAGAPAIARSQVRTEIEASVAVEFESWGKLPLALAAGSQQMNLLWGGLAVGVGVGSTATALHVGVDAAAGFVVGDLVAVDVDYLGQVGFVGSGVSGAYVGAALSDVEYVRRVSLNVGRVVGIAAGVLQLAGPLIAGDPVVGMKVSRVAGFVDREGGSFFQEWSGLFVTEGEQGDRVIYHYPRLQAMQGAAEVMELLAGPLERVRLAGAFRALPVKDAVDGETVVCFRSYLVA